MNLRPVSPRRIVETLDALDWMRAKGGEDRGQMADAAKQWADGLGQVPEAVAVRLQAGPPQS
ncbi:hypothetical protein BKE38_12570 [Pseudoroseomonas deserti]|uniref:Uncharacterized protein n=1 Tax=Teichococcus deserti TaxID=1817963 RepID=A0A1V2H4F3_9PROT|nr:hypothetical protein [Pseudoroseomonas deserti]ONG53289.1 hypothetical protein BKE38_12570 [Pseudoroseomonas deserti]